MSTQDEDIQKRKKERDLPNATSSALSVARSIAEKELHLLFDKAPKASTKGKSTSSSSTLTARPGATASASRKKDAA